MKQLRKVSWAAAALAALAVTAGQAVATADPTCGPLGDVFLNVHGFTNPGKHDVRWTLAGEGVSAAGSARVEYAAIIATGVPGDRPLSGTFSWWGSRGLETRAFTLPACVKLTPLPVPADPVPPVDTPATVPPVAPDPPKVTTPVLPPAKPAKPAKPRVSCASMRARVRAGKAAPVTLLRAGCVRVPACAKGRAWYIDAKGMARCAVRASSVLREQPAG